MEGWMFLGLALALGVKHAFDADHLAATGAFLARAPGPRAALRLGLRWSLGHALAAGTLTLALFLSRDAFLASWQRHLDLAVGLTLVGVGLATLLWEARRVHSHRHRHGRTEHEHEHAHLPWRRAHGAHAAMFGIGVLHGFASNDELLVLLTTGLGVASLGGLLLGVGVFSAGVVAGMTLFAAALALPAARARAGRVRRALALAAGLASLGMGGAMLAGIG